MAVDDRLDLEVVLEGEGEPFHRRTQVPGETRLQPNAQFAVSYMENGQRILTPRQYAGALSS